MKASRSRYQMLERFLFLEAEFIPSARWEKMCRERPPCRSDLH